MSDNIKDKLEKLKEPKATDVEPDAADAARNFQQYESNRVATCLITKTGKRVNFTNNEYYTNDPEVIEYLDNEIASGLKGFKKGVLVTAEEVNPMASMRRKIIEEFKASQEGRDFSSGTLSKEELVTKSAILSTAGVTNSAE